LKRKPRKVENKKYRQMKGKERWSDVKKFEIMDTHDERKL